MFVRDHELADPYGGDVVQSGRYYAVGLAKPAVLDGEIQVWGPKFIHVHLVGRLAGGERDGVYTSEADALKFLKALLVDYDSEAADAVPVKPR